MLMTNSILVRGHNSRTHSYTFGRSIIYLINFKMLMFTSWIFLEINYHFNISFKLGINMITL